MDWLRAWIDALVAGDPLADDYGLPLELSFLADDIAEWRRAGDDGVVSRLHDVVRMELADRLSAPADSTVGREALSGRLVPGDRDRPDITAGKVLTGVRS